MRTLLLMAITVIFCFKTQNITAYNNDLRSNQDSVKAVPVVQKEGDTFDKIRDLFNNRYLSMQAFTILRYAYDSKDQGSQSRHEFKVRAVFFAISGELNNQFRYNLLLDLGDPQLQEFWAEYAPSKYFNLRAGQFKSPLSLEIHYSPGIIEYGNMSRPTNYLMGYAQDVIGKRKSAFTRNSFGRDLGVQIHGTLLEYKNRRILDYAVAVLQGSGVNVKDPDNTKDFAGALTVYPINGLRIRGGVHFGAATYDNGDGMGEDLHVRNRYIVGAEYQKNRFKTRFEYMLGKDGPITRDGMYGMAMYDIVPKKFNTLGMVSYYNNNTNTKGFHQEAIDYLLGFNYNIAKLTRLQLNYTYTDYTKEWNNEYTNNHQVLFHLQVGF